ncbi:hypothetical protein ED312_14955, partial [Sinomicrobium pectinilyticum]
MNSKKKERFLKWGLLLLAFFPLIPNKFKGLPIILLFGIACINFKLEKRSIKGFFINSSPYWLYLTSLLYTSNYHDGLKKLETGLSLVIVPVIIFLLIPSNTITDKLQER